MSHIFCEKVDIHDTDHLFRINIHDIMTHLMTHDDESYRSNINMNFEMNDLIGANNWNQD